MTGQLDTAQLVAFNLALLAAIAVPGPSLLFLTRATLLGGRATGLITAAGLGCMAAAWTLAALLGLEGLFRLFPTAYVTFKTIGAGYLIWIAIAAWRGAGAPVGDIPPPSHRRAFASGVLVNLANPKSVMFAAAVIVVIFPPNLSPVDKAVIFGNHLAVELTIQPLFVLLLSTATVRRRYMNAKPVLDRISAAIMGMLGMRLLLDR